MLLPRLADWSAFLEQVLLTISIHDWDNRTHGEYYMEEMVSTPMVVSRLLGPLSMFAPMADTSWTHNYVIQTVLTLDLTNLQLPTLPITHSTPFLSDNSL